jgi:hypothetical protein
MRKPTPSLRRFDTPRERRGRIVSHLAGRQPVILGVLQVVENFRRPQQRLGRNAAPVEADAAEIFALNNGGLESELRRADRGDITARARTDDDDVETLCRLEAQTRIANGFCSSRWSVPRSLAPKAPSITR